MAGVVVAAAWLSGCGGGEPIPLSTTVTGSRVVSYWQDDGTVRKFPPADLATTSVAALVREGGAWREALGTVNANGTFTIHDVGTSSYLLRLTGPSPYPRFWELTTRAVDLGADAAGRPFPVAASLSTPVTFALTGLSPWVAGDRLALVSTGARLGATIPATPVPGDTAGDYTLDWLGRPLPEAGDLGWVLQYEQTSAATVPVSAVVRSGTVALTSSLPDGQAATWPLALGSPPRASIAADVRRSQFAALLAGVAPGGSAALGDVTLAVRAVPWTPSSSSPRPSLLSASVPPSAGDVNLGTLSYGRPFPSWFTELLEVTWLATVDVPAALGAPAASVTYAAQRVEWTTGAPSVIAPTLGPARLPSIGGQDAAQPQAGVGLTPTLSWSAPALGVPTRYSVTLTELPAVAGSAPTVRAWFSVASSSIAIPPGLLEVGKVYFAVVWAVREPNGNPAAPHRPTVPRESAPMVTAPFTP
jgi:hypothetical protein